MCVLGSMSAPAPGTMLAAALLPHLVQGGHGARVSISGRSASDGCEVF